MQRERTERNRTGELLPTGFQGPVRNWASLVPAAERVLRLPRDRESLGGALPAPPGARSKPQAFAFDLIEIQSLTESTGRVEDALGSLAARLADGGTLLLDVENAQSLRQLRAVVEGRPGSFDPAGSPEDPAQALPLRRVLHAAAAAGLRTADVLRVPEPTIDAAQGLVPALFREGFVALDWLAGPPPQRFWLVCERQPPCAGTALIGPGDAVAQARTEAALRAFLPPDFEVLRCEPLREAAAWNRGVAGARGRTVWFLRAGAEPTRALFDALLRTAPAGAAAPGDGTARSHPGDVTGLFAPRLDVLLAGPIAEWTANSAVALEEFAMRFDAANGAPLVAAEPLVSPPSPIEAPASFAAEAQELVQRWSLVNAGAAGTGGAAALRSTAEPKPAPWAGREPRISLCMIAKDEERFLADCLHLAKDCFDEFVLVDTGSTDATVRIAESFGAKVLRAPWTDDFAAPRNVGLAAATGDWILVLDADERLRAGSAPRLRELARATDVAGYHLKFLNDYGGGRTMGVRMVRLFRNLPGVAYEGVIHEQVTPTLVRAAAESGLVLASADLEVVHLGYADEVIDARGKNARNERLFAKQLERSPDCVYTLYKFGDFLRRLPGRAEQARDLLERCFATILQGPPTLPRELPYAGEVAALCALELARAGAHARAREVIDLALRRFVPTPNLHYLAASLLLAAGRADDAIAHYRRCLAYRGQTLVVPIQDGVTSYVAFAGIGQAMLAKGEIEAGTALLERAIEIEPAYEVAHLALSRAWLVRGDAQRALQVLTDFLGKHPRSAGASQQATLLLQKLGLEAQAKRMGAHALALLQQEARGPEAAAMQEILAGIRTP